MAEVTDKEYLDPQGIYNWSKADLAEWKAMQNKDKAWSDEQKKKNYKSEVREAMSSKQASSELAPSSTETPKPISEEERAAAFKEKMEQMRMKNLAMVNEAPSGKKKNGKTSSGSWDNAIGNAQRFVSRDK